MTTEDQRKAALNLDWERDLDIIEVTLMQYKSIDREDSVFQRIERLKSFIRAALQPSEVVDVYKLGLETEKYIQSIMGLKTPEEALDVVCGCIDYLVETNRLRAAPEDR